MKRVIIVLAFCMAAVSAFSQLEFGLKGGLNLTNISADMTAGDYTIVSNPGSGLGYHIGGFMRASLFGIFIQPELLLTSIASEYTVTDLANSLPDQLAKQRIGRLDVPLMVGVKLGSLHIGLGPVGSLILSEKSDLTDITDYETSLKSATIGFQAGAGLDVWKLGFDVRYEGNLSKLGDEIVVAGQPVNFDSRARQVILSVSFRF